MLTKSEVLERAKEVVAAHPLLETEAAQRFLEKYPIGENRSEPVVPSVVIDEMRGVLRAYFNEVLVPEVYGEEASTANARISDAFLGGIGTYDRSIEVSVQDSWMLSRLGLPNLRRSNRCAPASLSSPTEFKVVNCGQAVSQGFKGTPIPSIVLGISADLGVRVVRPGSSVSFPKGEASIPMAVEVCIAPPIQKAGNSWTAPLRTRVEHMSVQAAFYSQLGDAAQREYLHDVQKAAQLEARRLEDPLQGGAPSLGRRR
jgi:hypothetical protein